MTPQEIEQEIMKVLADEKTAVGISIKLFAPDGLFSRLASTEAERRVLVKSPLYRQAQQRFRELQFQEAEVFRQVISSFQETNLGKECVLKIERPELTK